MPEFREMRRKRQQLDRKECEELLSREKRGALALCGDGGYPYVIPMDYYFDADKGRIYFHGAGEGHKIDSLKRDDRASFCVWERGHIAPGDWAYTVRSVVAFGRIRILEDKDSILYYARRLGQKYYPSEELLEKEIRASGGRVTVLELEIEHMSGKLVHEK